MSLLALVLPIAEHLVSQAVASGLTDEIIAGVKTDVIAIASKIFKDIEPQVIAHIEEFIEYKLMSVIKDSHSAAIASK